MFSHRFPPRLENSAKNNYAEFSTVTTAPTAIYLKEEKRGNSVNVRKLDQIVMDKRELGA